jgi:integrase
MRFYSGGVYKTESTRTSDPAKAARILERKIRALRNAIDGIEEVVEPQMRDTRVRELIEDLLADLKSRELASLRTAICHSRRVLEFFGDDKATSVTPARITNYNISRREAGASKATVDNETSVLKQALRLGFANGKLARLPRQFPRKLLKRDENAKQGFFTQPEVTRLIAHLGRLRKGEFIADPDVQAFVLWGWATGMRLSEIASLTWTALDVEGAALRLAGADAKNDRPRVIPLVGLWGATIAERLRARVPGCEFIFHRRGRKMGTFDKMFSSAAALAGCAGRTFHDLRRSAVRNMVRSGVPQSVAMRISGHKTDSVFRRYAIVATDDLRDAGEKLTAMLGAEAAAAVAQQQHDAPIPPGAVN